MMFMSVDFPEPDAPMIATNSPRSIREAHAAQRVDLLVAELVDLGDVLDLDRRGRPRRLELRDAHSRGPVPAVRLRPVLRNPWSSPAAEVPGLRRGDCVRRRPG